MKLNFKKRMNYVPICSYISCENILQFPSYTKKSKIKLKNTFSNKIAK